MKKILTALSLSFAMITFSQTQRCIDDYNAGVQAKKEKRYETALALYKKAANDCEMDYALMALGKMYYHGDGVDRDWCEAYKWLNRANYLDSDASAMLGLLTQDGNNPCDGRRQNNTTLWGTWETNSTSSAGTRTKATVQLERGTYTGEVINGKPDGEGVLTLKDGGVITGQFKNGVEHGRCSICKDNLCESFRFTNGEVSDGEFWSSNRTTKKWLFKGKLVNGKIHGELKYFNPKPPTNVVLESSLLFVEIWENGEFIGLKECYDLYGNLIFKNGTGTHIEVNEEGIVIRETKYVNNCISGAQIFYHANGKKKLEVIWKCSDNNSLLLEVVGRYDSKGNSLPKGTLKNGTGTLIAENDENQTIEYTYLNGEYVSQRKLK